jgi:hypothetical protein
LITKNEIALVVFLGKREIFTFRTQSWRRSKKPKIELNTAAFFEKKICMGKKRE